ncbi:concanavalin A-like lectin/glucanase domain-containing protein [Lophiotrema nucula]|uniref:Concanavalin A-like lectin/glucanase domain-containing protein n=1 Tax=Lophiotrema nucula TaxID=690887 RepID=A0A6A5ZNC6_9PLEO|nr:concanavalin A-like lectin/glucanase domain-containing protein [Lophiotrema nucula]
MISFLPPLGAIALPLTLLLQPTLAADYSNGNVSALHDNNPNCSCYTFNSGDNSDSPEYLQYYRFFDFRNLANGPRQYIKAPPEVNSTQDQGDEDVWDANILNGDAWNVDWGIQNWSKPASEDFPTRMVNSPANVYVLQNEDSNDAFTFLTLRTSRLDDFQSAAEIENEQKNLMHCTMRMMARVVGSKGAVAGFFTFFDDDNESDIEILTDDPRDMIRYTNQPALDKEGNEEPEASKNPDNLPAWDDWQEHRIDWFEKNSYWYINNKQVASNTYSVPRKPSGLVINMWSDGGEWSGNMTVGDSAEFQIQWIELAFNTSGPVDGPEGGNNKRSMDLSKREDEKKKNCEVVCGIDNVKTKGTPEVLSINRSAAAGMTVSWGLLLVVALASMVVGF